MAEKQIAAVEPDPTTPGMARARFADGSYGPPTTQGVWEQEAARQAQQSRSAGGFYGQGGAPQMSMAPGTTAQPVSNGQPQTNNEQNAQVAAIGAGALGVRPSDFAASYAARQMGHNIDPLTLAATRKTTVTPGQKAINADTEAQQLAWRTGQQRVVEGAHPVDEERLAHVQELARRAVDAQSQASLADAQATRDTANAQALAASQLQAQMQAEQDRRQQDYDNQHSQFLQEVDDASKSEPDRQRWFKQHGAIGTIFAILGSAAEGYAKGLHGQYGPSMLERFVNQDMALQEREIERRGASANNKLAQLSQQWGSLEAGRAALRAGQYRLADSQLAQVAANTKAPAIQKSIEAQRAMLEQKIAQQDYDLRAAAEGTQRIAESAQYVSPRKAIAGGVRTTYDIGKALNNEQEQNRYASAQNEKAQDKAGTIAEKTEFIQPAREALASSAEARGYVRGPNGKWTLPRGGDDLLHGVWDKTALGAGHVPLVGAAWNAMSDEQKARQLAAQKHEEASLLYRRAMYSRAGANGNEDSGGVSHDQIGDMLLGRTGAGGAAALNAAEEALNKRESSYKAGAGRRGTAAFEGDLEHEETKVQNENRREGHRTTVFQKTGGRVE